MTKTTRYKIIATHVSALRRPSLHQGSRSRSRSRSGSGSGSKDLNVIPSPADLRLKGLTVLQRPTSENFLAFMTDHLNKLLNQPTTTPLLGDQEIFTIYELFPSDLFLDITTQLLNAMARKSILVNKDKYKKEEARAEIDFALIANVLKEVWDKRYGVFGIESETMRCEAEINKKKAKLDAIVDRIRVLSEEISTLTDNAMKALPTENKTPTALLAEIHQIVKNVAPQEAELAKLQDENTADEQEIKTLEEKIKEIESNILIPRKKSFIQAITNILSAIAQAYTEPDGFGSFNGNLGAWLKAGLGEVLHQSKQLIDFLKKPEPASDIDFQAAVEENFQALSDILNVVCYEPGVDLVEARLKTLLEQIDPKIYSEIYPPITPKVEEPDAAVCPPSPPVLNPEAPSPPEKTELEKKQLIGLYLKLSQPIQHMIRENGNKSVFRVTLSLLQEDATGTNHLQTTYKLLKKILNILEARIKLYEKLAPYEDADIVAGVKEIGLIRLRVKHLMKIAHGVLALYPKSEFASELSKFIFQPWKEELILGIYNLLKQEDKGDTAPPDWKKASDAISFFRSCKDMIGRLGTLGV